MCDFFHIEVSHCSEETHSDLVHRNVNSVTGFILPSLRVGEFILVFPAGFNCIEPTWCLNLGHVKPFGTD